MARIIRLTESDLIRLVKRVIREQEDWTSDNETELSSTKSKYDNLSGRLSKQSSDLFKKHQDNLDDLDWDEVNTIMNDPERMGMRKKLSDLSDRKQKYHSKKEYDDTVRNRPSDFDVDDYNDEVGSLERDFSSARKEVPNPKDFENLDSWASAADKFSKKHNLSTKYDRYGHLLKHLGRDRK